MRRFLFSLLVPALLLAVAPRTAHAFSEDVCYPAGGGPLATCLPLPAACTPAGTVTPACRLAIVVAAQQGNFDGGRSSVHTDVTYLLAQAVGFSATDAYWIAAYDEATDLGTFTPRDNNSVEIGSGSLTTANISGVVRDNFTSGGPLLHFIAPYNNGLATPPPGVDGLHPDPHDASIEPTLANFRAWALASSSAARPACTMGFTVASSAGDHGTGAACYAPGTPIQGAIGAFGTLALSFATQSGPQLVQDGATPVYAPDFDALVATDGAHTTSAAHAGNARLGVYLHLLADRITHHVCTDRTAIAGPTGGGFTVALDNSDCVQPLHLLRHAWETGISFATLAAKDRTTEAMLDVVYQELVAFARSRGVLRAGADGAATQSAYTSALLAALQIADAPGRVAALHQVGCAHQLAPLPGQPACP